MRPQENLGDIEKIKKNAQTLLTQCEKLESSFMYDSIPVSHIRNVSSWARYTTSSEKKVLIIDTLGVINAKKYIDEATRLSTLVNDLLDITKIQSGFLSSF